MYWKNIMPEKKTHELYDFIQQCTDEMSTEYERIYKDQLKIKDRWESMRRKLR